MIVTVMEHSERINLEIDGHGTAEGITWPEAMQLLDKAYTEDIATAISSIDTYIKMAQAGIVQTANALDALKAFRRTLEERHLTD